MAEEEPPQKKRPGPKPAPHAEWCNSVQNAGHKSCNCGATKKSKAKLEASGLSGDGSTSSPAMVASSSSAAVITTTDAAALLATTKQTLSYEGGALLRSPRGEESYLELENIADALDTMKGEKINGAVEELYFDAGSMKDKLHLEWETRRRRTFGAGSGHIHIRRRAANGVRGNGFQRTASHENRMRRRDAMWDCGTSSEGSWQAPGDLGRWALALFESIASLRRN